MNQRSFRALLMGALLLLGATLAAAQNLENVTLEATPVAGNVHMILGQFGGNIGVSAGDDGILIVDDLFAPVADKIRAALAEVSPGDLEFVLNTHWHGDHTGANPAFGEEAVIVAHTNVRKRLQEGSPRQPPTPEVGLPVITYDDGLSIHFNGEEIRVVHLPPSHTDGDSYVHFTASNVVHLGDMFFAGMFPFVDHDSGGSVTGLRDNIAKLLESLPEDAAIIPGHGPLATRSDLSEYHRMIAESLEMARQAIAAGKDLEAFQEQGFGPWADWSWPFITSDRWAAILYRELSG